MKKNNIPDTFMVSCAILCKKDGMAEYFKNRCENFALITVIPKFSKGQKPKCELFHNGELVKSFDLITIPDFITDKSKYFIHIGYIISIFYASIKLRKRFKYFIGEGHIYSLAGIVLKKLGINKKVIYSSGDYFVDVKSYQVIDKFLANQVDAIWNASAQMGKERLKNIGRIGDRCIQVTMPLGVKINDQVSSSRNFNSRSILFIGNIQKHQGLDLFLDAMPDLIKMFPDISLDIVGTGMYQDETKKKVSDLGLNKHVTFHGFIESESEANKIFSKCVLGLALYIPELSTFTKLSDPGKIKDYISAGLPVITTKVFNFSKELAQKKAGEVIDYNKDQLLEATSKILSSESELRSYSANALSLAHEYEWHRILDRVYPETLTFWQKIDS